MYDNILLAVDLNEPSSWADAGPTAIEYCKAFGSKLHVITVIPDYGMTVVAEFFPEDFSRQVRARTERELAAFMSEHVPAEVVAAHSVRYGSVYEEILAAVAEGGFDLIVMASHRPELRDYLLGPNAARIVRHATCSVLVVRSRDPGQT